MEESYVLLRTFFAALMSGTSLAQSTVVARKGWDNSSSALQRFSTSTLRKHILYERLEGTSVRTNPSQLFALNSTKDYIWLSLAGVNGKTVI